ncbi:MAG: UDP-N-acetylmuramoyl-tripeptide--D-alanyl-D-alanine ligase [Bacteroidetes bacterium]|nr:UDP-N-acetylmuramoyl-tripeptide--D-alanyl-D-alanine ligase [Bacteroidota bacterium]
MQLEQLYTHYLASRGVTTDTRNIQPGSIFFALKGERFNANTFAAEALEKGAAYVVVDEIADEKWKEQYGVRLILVPDVLATLQQLAGHHRQQFTFPVLAITGSNGKTTTKELVAAVLSKKYRTAFTKGNLNNHIGVPLTLLSIDAAQTDFAVIEMGANHQREIASYCAYTRPDFGLITNVGLAHVEGFGGFEGVVKGKTELYADVYARGGKVFISADNELLLSKWKALDTTAEHLITYGQSSEYCRGQLLSGHTFLTLETEGVRVPTQLVGDYNFDNVMSAVCIGKYFGVAMADIKQAIEAYAPDNNRSQQMQWGTNTIIMDAYNANPSSMHEALNNFEKRLANNPHAQAVVVLGEMMELGEYAAEEHRKIADRLCEPGWQAVNRVLVGGGFEAAAARHPQQLQWFATTDEAKRWFVDSHLHNALILIKGSRKNELEKLLQ